MSTTVILYHNPRCSKSRAALSLLQVRDVDTQVIDYLAHPPSEAEIRTLQRQLGFDSPRQMMRSGDATYAELDLEHANDDALIAAMVAHPALIERPIVVLGDKAVLGRPLDNIEALLL